MDVVSHEQSVVRAMWAAFLVLVVALYQVFPEVLITAPEALY